MHSDGAQRRRASLVARHGQDAIAVSALQAGLCYLDDDDGLLAFRRALGLTLSLGGPIAGSVAGRHALWQRFLSRERRPVAVYLRRSDVDDVLAAAPALHVCGIGTDTLIDTQTPLDAHAPAVASALRKATRAGLTLDEPDTATRAAVRSQLDEVTQAYVGRSAAPVEMRFLNRPFSHHDDVGRLFLLSLRGDLLGYAVLDPYRRDDGSRGALLNMVRFGPTRVWGVYFAVVALLIGRLAAEGVRELSLGYAPLDDVDTAGASPRLARQMREAAARLSRVQYVARLAGMKRAFSGQRPQRYVATSVPHLVPNLLALVNACGVPLLSLIGPQWRSVVSRPPSHGAVDPGTPATAGAGWRRSA